jgi:hypothetical protein
MRFRIAGFGGGNDNSGERCFIDNIEIASLALAADETAFFEIDGQRVYFDGSGDPQIDPTGTEVLSADVAQVINNSNYGNPHGYSYSCKKDVTALIRSFTAEGDYGNRPGGGVYAVGGVQATEYAGDEWAYAGWSLIIIYASSTTHGHQLYIYDDFLYCDHDTNLDFDQDGQPGGTIDGFLVPAPVAGDVNAAKITCFVGEGDSWYSGDRLEFNGSPLSNPSSPWNNVWNGYSPGFTAEGVDVDTFYVTWASGLLETGDTQAQIDISTDIDIWNLVYIILSFRSVTTSGGHLSYIYGVS